MLRLIILFFYYWVWDSLFKKANVYYLVLTIKLKCYCWQDKNNKLRWIRWRYVSLSHIFDLKLKWNFVKKICIMFIFRLFSIYVWWFYLEYKYVQISHLDVFMEQIIIYFLVVPTSWECHLKSLGLVLESCHVSAVADPGFPRRGVGGKGLNKMVPTFTYIWLKIERNFVKKICIMFIFRLFSPFQWDAYRPCCRIPACTTQGGVRQGGREVSAQGVSAQVGGCAQAGVCPGGVPKGVSVQQVCSGYVCLRRGCVWLTPPRPEADTPPVKRMTDRQV